MKLILSACATFILFSAFAQQPNDEAMVKPKPENVLVYLSGAQISGKTTVNLQPETKTIIFSDLSGYIDANSVQVKALADLTILSVNYRQNYLQPKVNTEVNALTDSLLIYQKELNRAALQKNAFQEEILVLQANRSIGGSNTGVNVSELAKMTDFMRSRFNEASIKKLELEEREQSIRTQIVKIQEQINSLKNTSSKPSGEIVVQIAQTKLSSAKFEVSYFVRNCGWSPNYDIRVKDINTPAEITAKAIIRQNTGQDWSKVKLSLSTGNPSLGNSKPQLDAWPLYITDRSEPRRKRNYSNGIEDDRSNAPQQDSYKSESLLSEVVVVQSKKLRNVAGVTSSISSADITRVSSTPTNAIFEISLPYTILSDSKENLVEIQRYEVAANYAFFAIPKLERDAFLVADLIGWDKNELLPGDANVYFENNYVGKSYFDTRIVDDTLSFGLGRDNNVRITRNQVKELKEKVSFTGNQVRQTREFEIEIKNTRKTVAYLELEDQIPITTNQELSIELIGATDAVFDKQTGKLTWRLKLEPGESKKLTFGFTLKYPKKYSLDNF